MDVLLLMYDDGVESGEGYDYDSAGDLARRIERIENEQRHRSACIAGATK